MVLGEKRKFFLILIICVAVIGPLLLHHGWKATSTTTPNVLKAGKHPDFDVRLLGEAAKKYTDPNNIDAIPDEVIIEDFINIAFSDHNWNDDYPWLKEGFPSEVRYGGVDGDQWAQRWLKSAEKAENNRIIKFKNTINVYFPDLPLQDLRSPAYKHFASLLDSVSGITELKLNTLEYDPFNNADIRGIFLRVSSGLFPISNPFKRRVKSTFEDTYGYISVHGDPFYEHALINATRFTPTLNAQVEGYLLFERDHVLAISVCDIWKRHAEVLQVALSTECIFRSLGLPDQSLVFSNAILGAWNAKSEDLVTNTNNTWPINDGRHLDALAKVGVVTINDVKRVGRDYVNFYEAGGFDEVAAFYASHSKAATHFSQPTKYDELILRILYDRRIEFGMSPKDVRHVLPDVLPDAKKRIKKRKQ